MKLLDSYLINIYFREMVASRFSVKSVLLTSPEGPFCLLVQQISCQLLVNVMEELQWYLLAISEIEVVWLCLFAFYLNYVGRWLIYTGEQHVEDSKQGRLC